MNEQRALPKTKECPACKDSPLGPGARSEVTVENMTGVMADEICPVCRGFGKISDEE